jgi:heavy metal translocating P-type ATPase
LLNNVGDRDVEQGPPNFERVILLITGFQCGCCEGGVSRTLSRIAAVRNHQVNVVLARVEFELDTNRLSVVGVIKRLNNQTGYTFEEHVAPTGQVLELLVTDPARVALGGRPFGVTDVESSDKRPCRLLSRHASGGLTPAPRIDGSASGSTVDPSENPSSEGLSSSLAGQHPIRIHYNAKQIGARDVFDYYQRFDQHLILAPPAVHPSMSMGVEQARHALLYFLPALCFTLPVTVLAWAPVNHHKPEYAHVSLTLATLVQMIAIKEFVPNALRSLWYCGVFEMDFLIAFSSTVAYAFSVVSYTFQIRGRPLETGSFFETSTLLVTLILLGRVINEYARYRAAKSVSFRSLQLNEALLVLPNAANPAHPKTLKIDARLLQYGDQFSVPPHTRVVTDGTVLHGGSEIDESMITGESIPVAKGVHSTVSAGTTNGGGSLVVKLTALPHENSVQKIAAMVDDAELTKPKVQALADRIAGWFVPIMAVIGFSVFLIWILVDRFSNDSLWRDAAVRATTYSIATLVVSCPCAIGLAVPMVVLIAGGVAARFGIIIRDPQKLETARNITDIVFDKTGTLTCGVLTVVGADYHDSHTVSTKGILLSLLQNVNHPVAIGVLRHLEREAHMNPEKNIKPIAVHDVTSIPGAGLAGTCQLNGSPVRAGNPDWLYLDVPETACTLFCVTVAGVLTATFRLKDRPRHTAEMVINKLQERGIQTHLISGDGEGPVDDVAHCLSIPKRNTKYRCTPEGKMNYVRDLQMPGKVVMFVGDGTNDAVALKQADVGVHINQGSDVAKSAADIVLMTSRLHDVLILLDISTAAYRRIIVNFAWSAFYNVSAILLAAGAFTRVMDEARIKPQYAGLGELVSVLPVVLIAFQMRWRNYGQQYRAIEYDYLKADAPMQKHVVRMRSDHSSSDDSGHKIWTCSPCAKKKP